MFIITIQFCSPEEDQDSLGRNVGFVLFELFVVIWRTIY